MNLTLQNPSGHTGERLRTAAFSPTPTRPSPTTALPGEGYERRRPTSENYFMVETALRIPPNVSGIHLSNSSYVFSYNVFQTYQLRPWYAYLPTLYGESEVKTTMFPPAGTSNDPIGPDDTSPSNDQTGPIVVAEPCSLVQTLVYYMSLPYLNVGTVYQSCFGFMYYLLIDFKSVCYKALYRTKCFKRHTFVVTLAPYMLGLYQVTFTGHNVCKYLVFCNNRIHPLQIRIFNSHALLQLSYTIITPTVISVTSRLCPELYSVAPSVYVILTTWLIPRRVSPLRDYYSSHYMFSVCFCLLSYSSISMTYEAKGHVSLLRCTSALEHAKSHPYATTNDLYTTRTSAVLQQVGPSFHGRGNALEDSMLPPVFYVIMIRTLSIMMQMRTANFILIMLTVSLLFELLRHAKYQLHSYTILTELSLTCLFPKECHTLKYMSGNPYMLLAALTTISEMYHVADKQYNCHAQSFDPSYILSLFEYLLTKFLPVKIKCTTLAMIHNEYKPRTYSQIDVVIRSDDFKALSREKSHSFQLDHRFQYRPISQSRTDAILTCRWNLVRSLDAITWSPIDAIFCLILLVILLCFIYNAARNEVDLIVIPYVRRKPHSHHIYAYSSHPYLLSKNIEDPTKKLKPDAPQTSRRRIQCSNAAADMTIPSCMCKVNIPPVRPDGTDVCKMTCISCQCRCEEKAPPNFWNTIPLVGMVILSGPTLRYVCLLCFIVIRLLENVYMYTRWIETT